MEEQCVFCSIRDGKTPSYKVYEDDYVFAVLDIKPANPGHLLVAPKKHYPLITQLTINEMAQLFSVARTMIPVILAATGAKGANIVHSAGPVAGQRSPHAFLNVIPRFEDDDVIISWKSKEMDEQQFRELQKKIVSTLSEMGGQKPKAEEPKPEPKKEELYKVESRPAKYW